MYILSLLDMGVRVTLLYEELTAKIIEASFEVVNELGAGFLESVYQQAMLVVLAQKGLRVRSQAPI